MSWVVFASSALLAWCYGTTPGPRRLLQQFRNGILATIGSALLVVVFAHVFVPVWVFLIVWALVIRMILVDSATSDAHLTLATDPKKGNGRDVNATAATPTTRRRLASGHPRE